jgi:N6-adenosine-specific RNA methylase IME4
VAKRALSKPAKKEIPFRPIEMFGRFRLTATGLEVTGRPTLAEYQAVGEFISKVQKGAGWWLADWLAYGETRDDWKEKLSQVVDAGLVRERTARNHKYIGENVPPSRRREDVDFSLHAEVASLSPKEQTEWLARAADHDWSVRDLRAEIRAAARPRTITGQAALEGMYRVIYADPPWLYRDSGATADGSLGKAERHYAGMTIEQLSALPVQAHAMPDSILFLWVTAPVLLANPGPRDVLEAWGFTYKTNFTWDKVLGMRGHYSHVTHEHLVVAVRGSCLPDRPTPQPKSSQTIRRSGEHSEKPEDFRRMIMAHWDGPYLELFGRKRVEGWTVFGNDARLWAKGGGGADIKDEEIPF